MQFPDTTNSFCFASAFYSALYNMQMLKDAQYTTIGICLFADVNTRASAIYNDNGREGPNR